MSQFSPSDQTSPLIGEARRQAIDSLEGYDYQIWRTVEAWMMLGPGDILYIECAEDYDVVSETGVLMAQVKKSPKSITLNSADHKIAIENFWTANQRNRGRGRLVLRFLTRGEIGHERDREFGDEKGLELWNNAAGGDSTAARRLTRHLQKTLSNSSLINYLETAEIEQVIDELFRNIEWVTGEPSIAVVQLAVQRMAIQRGAQNLITAQQSAKAVAGLLVACRQVAIRKESHARSLTLEDLQLVFEQHTTLPIPITNNIQASLNALIAPGASRSSFLAAALGNDLPPLGRPYLPRADFVATVANTLLESPAVLIVGSEGRGKTTVANIFGHQVDGNVRWVDLTVYPDEPAVALALADTLIAVRAMAPPKCVILDNLPVAHGVSDYLWTSIKALLDSCERAKITLLLTAKGVVEDTVDPRFRSAQIRVLSAPVLSHSEVEDFFSALGCPQDMTANWAKVSILQSGNGHPKLVYLHGLELRDRGWPSVTANAFTAAPTSIEEARAHTRLVASRAVCEADRPLLYTLSLATVPFDRTVALNIGAALAISAPGESFDRLAGRWIELRDSARYGVTTMLNGQAQKIWADNQLCRAHQLLFDAFVDRKTLRVDQAFGIFLHAMAGREAGRLRDFLASLLHEDFEQVPHLAEALDTLILIGGGLNSAVPFDSECSILLRTIQFRIARVCAHESLAAIAESWEWEVEQLPHAEKPAARVIRGLSISCCMDGDLPPSVVIRALQDGARYHELNLGLEVPPASPLFGSYESVSMLAWLFAGAQTRCKNTEDLNQFLSALDAVDPSIRAQMLQAFDAPYAFTGISMVENAWFGEAKRDAPDWNTLISVLERAVSLGTQWKCEQLCAAAIRMTAVIYDEQLGDSESALKLLRYTSLNRRYAVLEDQQANILFRRGAWNDALRIWQQNLSVDIDLGVPSARWHDRFSMRKAAIAAGKLGLFDEAARWLERGAEASRKIAVEVPASAFEVDAAYCWYKHGEPHGMIRALSVAAVSLGGDYDKQADIYQFAAQKNLGNTVLWINSRLLGDAPHGTEPSIGSASNPDIDQDGYRTLPATPPALTALMILDLAHKIGVQTPELAKLLSSVEASTNAVARFQYDVAQLRWTLQRGEIDALGQRIYSLQYSIWASAEARKSEAGLMADFPSNLNVENQPLSPDLPWLLLLGLVLRTIDGGNPESIADSWIASLQNRPRADDFGAIIRGLLPHFAIDAQSAPATMRKSPPSVASIGAAARMLASDFRNPGDTLQAQAALLYWFLKSPAQIVIESSLDAFDSAFSIHWQKHISVPNLLVKSRMTVPVLEAAINSSAQAAERLQKLLLAGCTASNNFVPAELIDGLEKLALQQRALARFREYTY